MNKLVAKANRLINFSTFLGAATLLLVLVVLSGKVWGPTLQPVLIAALALYIFGSVAAVRLSVVAFQMLKTQKTTGETAPELKKVMGVAVSGLCIALLASFPCVPMIFNIF